MKEYNKILKDANIRPSIQRLAIFAFLKENKIHPDVETIFTQLSPLYPTLSRTTVYNTLQLFEENKIIQAVKIDDDKIRYDADTSYHIHFKCCKCNRIFDVYNKENTEPFINNFKNDLPSGFVINNFQTNVWGICSECR
mgnify:FL=1